MIRWSIQQTLGAAGHEVAVAETVAEGESLLPGFDPDVVFLDVRLPDGSGLDVLRQIRQCGAHAPAVILMTAYADSCSAAEARQLGAFAYLQKPFDFEQLETLADTAGHARR